MQSVIGKVGHRLLSRFPLDRLPLYYRSGNLASGFERARRRLSTVLKNRRQEGPRSEKGVAPMESRLSLEQERGVEFIAAKLPDNAEEAERVCAYALERLQRRLDQGSLVEVAKGGKPRAPAKERSLKRLALTVVQDLPDDGETAREMLRQAMMEVRAIHGALAFKIKELRAIVDPLSSLAASFAAGECLCCLLRMHWLPMV